MSLSGVFTQIKNCNKRSFLTLGIPRHRITVVVPRYCLVINTWVCLCAVGRDGALKCQSFQVFLVSNTEYERIQLNRGAV